MRIKRRPRGDRREWFRYTPTASTGLGGTERPYTNYFPEKIIGGKEMVDVRLVTGVMLGSGVRKDQRVVDRTLE